MAVDELTRFSNICLCITSRISTIPPDCRIINVPTLSTEAAQDAFYRVYGHDERSNSINDVLEQLDGHPLSITLLATVAQQNQWDASRLAVEWGKQRTGVLRTQHSQILEVVAFLPQGVNEKNIDWLFTTIPDVQNMLDRFCILSLAY